MRVMKGEIACGLNMLEPGWDTQCTRSHFPPHSRLRNAYGKIYIWSATKTMVLNSLAIAVPRIATC